MSRANAKVPATPPATLTLDASEHLKTYDGVLWRVFATRGAHPQAWDELRHFGPVETMRFDPHPEPQQHHAKYGVMYTAGRSTTALGEVFQRRRLINRHARGSTLAAWRPTRELKLLDLTSNWPVVNGTTASIQMGPKRYTRTWANAIHDQLGADIDGLYHMSSIDFGPMVTLFTRAEDSFPLLPLVHTRLDSSSANIYLAKAARKLGYRIKK
ncbi:RES domain-containing protein [Microbacterium sp. NPDC088619]|uniref:RES domain-containing protein n=1 Tax=Microbacterium sp. NPDC088619 TaxID=3364196 RepID=UPI0038171157